MFTVRVDKASLSERDICTKFSTPAVCAAAWDLHAQIREEVSFTKGRIIVRGRVVSRGTARRVDYVLYHKPNLPLAVIEAKHNTAEVRSSTLADSVVHHLLSA